MKKTEISDLILQVMGFYICLVMLFLFAWGISTPNPLYLLGLIHPEEAARIVVEGK